MLHRLAGPDILHGINVPIPGVAGTQVPTTLGETFSLALSHLLFALCFVFAAKDVIPQLSIPATMPADCGFPNPSANVNIQFFLASLEQLQQFGQTNPSSDPHIVSCHKHTWGLGGHPNLVRARHGCTSL